jgi:hypothetical protein
MQAFVWEEVVRLQALEAVKDDNDGARTTTTTEHDITYIIPLEFLKSEHLGPRYG